MGGFQCTKRCISQTLCPHETGPKKKVPARVCGTAQTQHGRQAPQGTPMNEIITDLSHNDGVAKRTKCKQWQMGGREGVGTGTDVQHLPFFWEFWESLLPTSQPMYLRTLALTNPAPQDSVEQCLFGDSNDCSTDANDSCKARKKRAKLKSPRSSLELPARLPPHPLQLTPLRHNAVPTLFYCSWIVTATFAFVLSWEHIPAS